jgi:hypothetical protein
MNTKKNFGMSLVGVLGLALAGCGGGSSGNAPAPVVTGPGYYGQGQGQPINTPFTCQAGWIQLRNRLGQNQCFNTAISQACSQLGGVLVQGSLCRKERSTNFRSKLTLVKIGSGTSQQMKQLWINLFPGEGVKVYGNIDTLRSSATAQWSAELIQQGMILGSASGDTNRYGNVANLSITGTPATGYNTGYNNQYPTQYGNQYPTNTYTNPYNTQYAGQYGTQYGNQYMGNYGGIFSNGYSGNSAIAVPNVFMLQLSFNRSISASLEASAISCEDGQGNSYPCQ